MRSKTEAKIAQWFDEHAVRWIYEPEHLLSDIQYTPDFYLPEMDTLVEVKPVIFYTEIERHRSLIERLRRTFVVLSVGHANTVLALDLFEPLDGCDPYYNGDPDPWGWHSGAPDDDQRRIYFDDNGARYPRPFFYMGTGCSLRHSFGRECPCTK